MAKLNFRLTPGESLDFPLNGDVTRLGRNPGNEIVINNTWISSFHAEFRRKGALLMVCDLKSSNGTTVNGVTITEQELRHGDRIGFGQLEAFYDAEAMPPATSPLPVPAPAPEPLPKTQAAAAVQVRAMTPPPATIAYDNVRKEAELELEELGRKLRHAKEATAKAVLERAEAEAALTRVREESDACRVEGQQSMERLTATKAELAALVSALAAARGEAAAEARQLAERREDMEKLERRQATLAAETNETEQQAQAAATALATAVAGLEFRAEETAAAQARLDHLRRETEAAEALNSKVTDLRQQQAEAERRLDFLSDRLAGMSDAPDPNWGTVHSLARSFIKKLDLIDDLIAHLTGQPEAASALDQVQVFRAGLLDILREYTIEAYSPEPGTVIDVAARKRIQIVETLSEGGHDGTRIVRTYRPGYVCLNGDLGISTLLRKADVAVSIPLG